MDLSSVWDDRAPPHASVETDVRPMVIVWELRAPAAVTTLRDFSTDADLRWFLARSDGEAAMDEAGRTLLVEAQRPMPPAVEDDEEGAGLLPAALKEERSEPAAPPLEEALRGEAAITRPNATLTPLERGDRPMPPCAFIMEGEVEV